MTRPTPNSALKGIEQVRSYELEEARHIQNAMVALEPLIAPGVEFATLFRPVLEVGGDFLDYFWLDEEHLGFYIGDVVGKGLPAAMYAALTVGTLRGINKGGEPPENVLALLNSRLRMRLMPGRYAAVQYGAYVPAGRNLYFANAGLPRPVLISAGGCREVGEGGLPSGLFPQARYEPCTVTLHPGESVLFATDGITEARNTTDEEFGLERLLESCFTYHAAPAASILVNIAEELDRFTAGARPHDDMTAAVLKVV